MANKPYSYICITCNSNLEKLQISSSITTFDSIYHYEGIVRTLILRTKVQSDVRALQLLRTLFLNNLKTRDACAWCTHIMPAPSSLWGRLRGRFDIANYIAHTLSKEFKKQLITPPFNLRWRLKKRAFINKKQSAAKHAKTQKKTIELPIGINDDFYLKQYTSCINRKNPNKNYRKTVPDDTLSHEDHNLPKKRKILVIDDIITTGNTLRSIYSALQIDNVKFLTLAKAINKN